MNMIILAEEAANVKGKRHGNGSPPIRFRKKQNQDCPAARFVSEENQLSRGSGKTRDTQQFNTIKTRTFDNEKDIDTITIFSS
jgi:hypothetical protein